MWPIHMEFWTLLYWGSEYPTWSSPSLEQLCPWFIQGQVAKNHDLTWLILMWYVREVLPAMSCDPLGLTLWKAIVMIELWSHHESWHTWRVRRRKFHASSCNFPDIYIFFKILEKQKTWKDMGVLPLPPFAFFVVFAKPHTKLASSVVFSKPTAQYWWQDSPVRTPRNFDSRVPIEKPMHWHNVRNRVLEMYFNFIKIYALHKYR